MELIVIWLGLCGVVAFWANNRGQNGAVIFFVSVLLSPLIGALIVLISGDKSRGTPVTVSAPVNSAATADALTKLVALRDAGHITEEEFQQQRAILFPKAAGPGLTVHNQAMPDHQCGRCHRPLSPAWVGKCSHCGATYAMYPPEPRTA